MTDHRDVTAQSGSISWRLTENFIPSLLTGVLMLIVYFALLGADNLHPAQSAPNPAVAGGPDSGYTMDAAREERLAEESPVQSYTAWLRAAHAHAALDGLDEPLPNQF